ncbi:hypothetical protein BGZ93_004210 [Podila epicladia]|nr:hypothetical protein BGZ92_009236 [Podila epicladia]KAG0096631.1 hypothetical protein BGZ93_004210 [Podila epicladia]
MLVNTVQSHFKFDRFDQSPVGSFDSLTPLKPGHNMRKSPKSYHRRTVSCLAVASHHEHYEHPSYLAPTGRFYETVEFSEATSASPVNHTRHIQRKSEGNISLIQLQQGLSGAGVTNVISSDAKDKSEITSTAGSSLLVGKLIKSGVGHNLRNGRDSGCFVSDPSPSAQPQHLQQHLSNIQTRTKDSPSDSIISLSQLPYLNTFAYGDCKPAISSWLCGADKYDEILADPLSKSNLAPRLCCYCSRVTLTPPRFQKMSVASPAPAPRRSLLSDLLNSQAAPTRLEQNANRRRMLKSMRRYSVDASEMDFNLCSRPSGRATPMQTISSEGEASSECSTSSSSPGAMLINGNSFSSTPTVRYLRNPCHAAVKTKLQPSAYRSTLIRRGNDTDGDTPDYFGTEDRVW